MNLILSIFISLNFWIIYFCKYSKADVVVTVNLDKLPQKSDLKIYEGNIDPSCCRNFNKTGNEIFLILSRNLTYQKCNCTTEMFTIFPYFTNITTAIITVKNEVKPDTYQTLKNSNKTVILNSSDLYISFIMCMDINCTYEGVDQNEIISKFNSLKQYSACSNKPCLTYVEFGTEIVNFKIASTTYYSSTISVKASSLETKPKMVLNCRNGGKIIGNKCVCPRTTDFLEKGPECESLQMAITQKQFLYALPNSLNITIEFELYVTSFQGSTEIFTIMKEKKVVFKYEINETAHTLQVVDANSSVAIKTDTPPRWIFISIFVSNSEAKAVIDGKVLSFKQWLAEYYFDLDGIPLILYNKIMNEKKEMCISNLKVHKQIVDLYLPSSKNCQPNCDKCNENQTCIYAPFKSVENADCICKLGMRRSDNSQCQISDVGTVSLQNQKVTNVDKLPNDIRIMFLKFRFRTFSKNGILVSLNFSSPSDFYSSIRIINSNIFTNITNSKSQINHTIQFYNVSDGEWHQINYKMADNFIEVILDEDLQFNSVLLKFDNSFLLNPIYKLQAATFGPLENTDWNKFSTKSCIDGFSIIPPPLPSSQVQYPEVNSSSTTNGCEGNFCQNFTCSPNSNCENKWQNPTCVCNANFINTGGMCVFSKCLNPNPCKNGGNCTIGENSDYKCICSERFQGKNCEADINAAGFLWWIILLVLLILLLIIIIILIYCCCCRKRAPPQNGPDINKLHENTVFYNEPAGETDYVGPPINFNLMKFPQKTANVSGPQYPNDELKKRKLAFDTNNKDLIIDHPLDYGFEGVNSDSESFLSLGSGSTDHELNINPIEETNEKFKYLKNLYK